MKRTLCDMSLIMTRYLSIVYILLQVTFKESSAANFPLNVSTVFIEKSHEICPGEVVPTTISLVETLRSEVRNLIHESVEIIQMRTRVCECGYTGAGWRKVAFLNMTNSSQSCPGEWRLVTSPRRTCNRSVNNGCSLAAFNTGGVSYNEVCGRIIGYQYGSTDALYAPIFGITVDQASSDRNLYDGGVLISHGTAPRQHIWSLVSGNSQRATNRIGCPCNIGSTISSQIPSWLGQDYFCDSATVVPSANNVFYHDNPLWDGVGCDESLTTCCQFNNPPWFCKQLPQPTMDDIELRLCADSPSESTPIELVEIYVR